MAFVYIIFKMSVWLLCPSPQLFPFEQWKDPARECLFTLGEECIVGSLQLVVASLPAPFLPSRHNIWHVWMAVPGAVHRPLAQLIIRI